MDKEEAALHTLALEDRALAYYAKAAEKLKGQAEVARALKTLAKPHDREQKKLAGL